jgi:hypothetical protein
MIAQLDWKARMHCREASLTEHHDHDNKNKEE